MNVKAAVEAALYSASENLKISDIAARTNLPVEEVRTAVMDLRREYDDRDSAIQIAKIGTEYRMMLRPEYTEVTGTFAKAELSGGVLRTLTTIAYYQPVLQAELLKLRGPRVYEDVHTLVEMDFVARKRAGNTWELTTTKKFAEYFGIGSTRIKDIQAWIKERSSNL
ncbi:MAG: SMC-Scp complex subunit ScpB [Candidatus Methanomethylophilaceae archaeon]|nr:SMC-Scp complex subunit ScpB [Candidatus Methanomethylophilaceae archaeon]MBR4685214.1 SMC-Scp complex subunit ScpB [Candidatus Methanomethylophilaceae archaeon]